MNRIVLLLVITCCFPVLQVRADASPFWDLTIINRANETVCIEYKRVVDGRIFSKLLEDGEQLFFGRVVEASAVAASTMGTYLSPQKVVLLPVANRKPTREHDSLMLSINGVKNRSIKQLLGEWDVTMLTGALPAVVLPPQDRPLEAFPTVIKKLVASPRFILGLPAQATVADAAESASLLREKWQSIKLRNKQEELLVHKTIAMINDALTAFEQGKADEPLRGMATKGIGELIATD